MGGGGGGGGPFWPFGLTAARHPSPRHRATPNEGALRYDEGARVCPDFLVFPFYDFSPKILKTKKKKNHGNHSQRHPNITLNQP